MNYKIKYDQSKLVLNVNQKYNNLESYLSELQIKEKLFANIDLATGTGKSYVMYGIAQILLSEQVIKRVLVLCPSLTIESGLFEKFSELASNKELMHSIPETCKVVVP